MHLVDLGSSTVKIYKTREETVEPVAEQSFHFKDKYTEETGLDPDTETAVHQFINEHVTGDGAAYATSFFRNMEPHTREQFIERFEEETGVPVSIVSPEEETQYLEAALLHRFPRETPVLLVNIGGGSTELITHHNNKQDTAQLEVGVGTVLNQFDGINDDPPLVDITTITNWVEEQLPQLDSAPDTAFYTGGELTYMKRCNYPVEENTVFDDPMHPATISRHRFKQKNKDIFHQYALKELEERMPENPEWMHGARACSALAQSIFEKYGVSTIVPSDANMMHGIVRSNL